MKVEALTHAGNAKSYKKAGGAPAVLLRLNLETFESRCYRKYGVRQGALYHFFVWNPDRQDLWLASPSTAFVRQVTR